MDSQQNISNEIAEINFEHLNLLVNELSKTGNQALELQLIQDFFTALDDQKVRKILYVIKYSQLELTQIIFTFKLRNLIQTNISMFFSTKATEIINFLITFVETDILKISQKLQQSIQDLISVLFQLYFNQLDDAINFPQLVHQKFMANRVGLIFQHQLQIDNYNNMMINFGLQLVASLNEQFKLYLNNSKLRKFFEIAKKYQETCLISFSNYIFEVFIQMMQIIQQNINSEFLYSDLIKNVLQCIFSIYGYQFIESSYEEDYIEKIFKFYEKTIQKKIQTLISTNCITQMTNNVFLNSLMYILQTQNNTCKIMVILILKLCFEIQRKNNYNQYVLYASEILSRILQIIDPTTQKQIIYTISDTNFTELSYFIEESVVPLDPSSKNVYNPWIQMVGKLTLNKLHGQQQINIKSLNNCLYFLAYYSSFCIESEEFRKDINMIFDNYLNYILNNEKGILGDSTIRASEISDKLQYCAQLTFCEQFYLLILLQSFDNFQQKIFQFLQNNQINQNNKELFFLSFHLLILQNFQFITYQITFNYGQKGNQQQIINKEIITDINFIQEKVGKQLIFLQLINDSMIKFEQNPVFTSNQDKLMMVKLFEQFIYKFAFLFCSFNNSKLSIQKIQLIYETQNNCSIHLIVFQNLYKLINMTESIRTVNKVLQIMSDRLIFNHQSQQMTINGLSFDYNFYLNDFLTIHAQQVTNDFANRKLLFQGFIKFIMKIHMQNKDDNLLVLINNYISNKNYIDPTQNQSRIMNLFLNDLTILVESVQNIPKYVVLIDYIDDGLNIFSQLMLWINRPPSIEQHINIRTILKFLNQVYNYEEVNQLKFKELVKKQKYIDFYIQFASKLTTYLSVNSLALLQLSEENQQKYKIKTIRLCYKFIQYGFQSQTLNMRSILSQEDGPKSIQKVIFRNLIHLLQMITLQEFIQYNQYLMHVFLSLLNILNNDFRPFVFYFECQDLAKIIEFSGEMMEKKNQENTIITFLLNLIFQAVWVFRSEEYVNHINVMKLNYFKEIQDTQEVQIYIQQNPALNPSLLNQIIYQKKDVFQIILKTLQDSIQEQNRIQESSSCLFCLLQHQFEENLQRLTQQILQLPHNKQIIDFQQILTADLRKLYSERIIKNEFEFLKEIKKVSKEGVDKFSDGLNQLKNPNKMK